jgi:hypothetical protein
MRAQINLNGDDKDTLMTELAEVVRAADTLRDKLADLTVHGRNYPQGGEDFDLDREDRKRFVLQCEEVRRWAFDAMVRMS